MLPLEIFQLIFEYLGRTDRQNLLEVIPELDEKELLILEDDAAAILILFPRVVKTSSQQQEYHSNEHILIHDNNRAEYGYATSRGHVYVQFMGNKNNPSFEELFDINATYKCNIRITQSLNYDNIFKTLDTNIEANGDFVADFDKMESLSLVVLEKFKNFEAALEFVQQPIFKNLRDILVNLYPDQIRTIMEYIR